MKTNPMQIRSKNKLAKALILLMAERPFEKITICDIADRAELARRTFYTNFNSKDEVIDYSMTEVFRKLTEEVRFDRNFGAVLRAYFLFWERRAPFIRALLGNRLEHLFAKRNRVFFHELLRQGEINGRAENLGPFADYFFSGAMFSLLAKWIQCDGKLSADELTDIARRLFSSAHLWIISDGKRKNENETSNKTFIYAERDAAGGDDGSADANAADNRPAEDY